MSINKDQMKCRIEKLERKANELKNKLCNYDVVVEERDAMKCKMANALKKMDSIRNKQEEMFNELICKHDSLNMKYNMERERLKCLQNDNDSLQCKNEQLYDKLDEQDDAIDKLETIRVTLKEDAQKLKCQISEATRVLKQFQDRLRTLESEYKVKDQEMNCLQNTLAENITKHTKLEKKVCIEQDRNEILRSSINELKVTEEKTVRSLQAELTHLQCQLNEKLSELATIERNLKEKQEEIEMQKDRKAELKKVIKELREVYFKEKTKAEKEVCELRSEVKSIVSDTECINSKLCDAQIESTKLKCQLKGQCDKIRLLELTKDQIQQEVRRIKENKELTTKMLTAEREQHDREKVVSERRLASKAQEECELKKLIKKQTDQIKKFKKQIFNEKLNSGEKCELVSETCKTVEFCCGEKTQGKKSYKSFETSEFNNQSTNNDENENLFRKINALWEDIDNTICSNN